MDMSFFDDRPPTSRQQEKERRREERVANERSLARRSRRRHLLGSKSDRRGLMKIIGAIGGVFLVNLLWLALCVAVVALIVKAVFF